MSNTDAEFLESIPDRHHTSYEDAEFLEWLLGHLDARSRLVLELRNEGKTLEEIGQELGVRKQRIQVIESEALTKLRTIGEAVL